MPEFDDPLLWETPIWRRPMLVTVTGYREVNGERVRIKNGKFDAFLLDGRRICAASRTPYYDAARALLAEGVDPDTPLDLRHPGDSRAAMTGKIGELALWTISEGESTGPVRVRYQERPDLNDETPATPTE
jgi:hypothetical protein